MADAKTLFSLSLRDEASKQLKQFEGNYRRTVAGMEGGGEDSGLAAAWLWKIAAVRCTKNRWMSLEVIAAKLGFPITETSR